jgi:putative YhdH/YhfP family quinone oxidoreductase
MIPVRRHPARFMFPDPAMHNSEITCYLVDKQNDHVVRGVQQRSATELPDGEVLIEVTYSAVNYKDGLAAQGHPGVALALPLVPGIDAVGKVLESRSDRCQPGDEVMVTGSDFGTRSWGGWATLCRVAGSWCIPIPDGMTAREAVIIGTAGFTAAQSLEKLQHQGIGPEQGPVLVSGATGGVGIFAVRLLGQLGYHVVAATGKADRVDWLKQQGASEVIGREDLLDDSRRPLLSGRWAAAIDTVGGRPLETILRSTRPGGCVTACGLVAGHELNTTVYPFILRGICLHGIDSANASVDYREHLWQRLASDLKLHDLETLATDVALSDVEQSVRDVLAGRIAGRHVVDVRR